VVTLTQLLWATCSRELCDVIRGIMLFNYIRQVAAAFRGDRQSPYGANFYYY